MKVNLIDVSRVVKVEEEFAPGCWLVQVRAKHYQKREGCCGGGVNVDDIMGDRPG